MQKYWPEKRIISIRKELIIGFVLFFTILLSIELPTYAQMRKSENNPWFIGINAGMVSFFGDLSTKDYNPVWKTQTESDFGVGLTGGKRIGNLFAVSANVFTGRMKGNNPDLNFYFNNTFTELQGSIAFSLKEAIFPQTSDMIDVLLNVGGGQLFYKSVRRVMNDGTIVNEEGIPAPDYQGISRSALFFSSGIDLDYNFSSNWTARLGLCFRFTDSDLLDAYVGSTGINDRYSVLSAGILYKIQSGNSRSVRCTEEYKKYKKSRR